MMKERDVARHAHVVDPVRVSRPDAAGECGSDAPPEVVGSTRQPRPHPLFEEVRRHRATLAALLTTMRLPAATEEVGPKATSLKAWRAARSHWLKEVR
ncbi:MAG TPA: hypothetical protein VMM60_17855 [Ilumatobacter sp.]|nr:hypothetical protein [Ilumatobacter sp.]